MASSARRTKTRRCSLHVVFFTIICINRFSGLFLDVRSVRERGRFQADAGAAAGAQPVGHVAGHARRRAAGQRKLQRERTPDADGPEG